MTDKLTQVRLEKLNRLRKQGLDPYPARVNRSHTSSAAVDAFEAASKDEEVRVTVAGRLRSIREMGRTAFAHIEDGEGRLQLYLREDELGPDQLDLFFEDFDLGDFIQAEGNMFRTRSGEITVRVESFLIVSKAIFPLAMDFSNSMALMILTLIPISKHTLQLQSSLWSSFSPPHP